MLDPSSEQSVVLDVSRKVWKPLGWTLKTHTLCYTADFVYSTFTKHWKPIQRPPTINTRTSKHLKIIRGFQAYCHGLMRCSTLFLLLFIDVTSPGQPILHSAISHWQSNYAKGRFECLPLAVHQEPVETCNEKLSR